MENSEIGTAWWYHNGTMHPNGYLLDRAYRYHPSRRPTPFKVYPRSARTDLCLEGRQSTVSAIEAISTREHADRGSVPDIGLVSKILYFSCGITKSIDFGPPVGRIDFRAASCTGALYHIEAYLVCSDLAGLGAGVYYYEPKGNTLCLLRSGNHMGVIDDATADETFTSRSPAVLVFTDIFARNSVKYQAREYRHAFWDSGTILANAMATSAAYKVPYRLLMGFWDERISGLLGIDGRNEGAVALLALGNTDYGSRAIPPMGDVPKAPPPEYTSEFPAIAQMHEASSLHGPGEVASWRCGHLLQPRHGSGVKEPFKVTARGLPLEETIIRRGSTRKFSHESITADQLTNVLWSSITGIPCDLQLQGTICDMYLIANAVEGLSPGSYFYDKTDGMLAVLQEGCMRDVSGHLGLDQDLAYDSAATVFFMSDLQHVLETFGNRGYRVAQMDASITAGRMYLAAYALDIGATGLTFYDNEVTEFFSPHAERKSVMFMLAIGKKERKR